jgi:hypothetical protein
MPRLKRKRRGGKMRGGKWWKGRERIGWSGKKEGGLFRLHGGLKSEHAFRVTLRRKGKMLQEQFTKEIPTWWTDRGAGQFEIA